MGARRDAVLRPHGPGAVLGGDHGAILAAIKFRNPPEPREGGPLASLVLQMLRKRPEDRPDAATVAAILAVSPASQTGRAASRTGQDRSPARSGRAAPGRRTSSRPCSGPAPRRPEAAAVRAVRPARAHPGAGRRRHAAPTRRPTNCSRSPGMMPPGSSIAATTRSAGTCSAPSLSPGSRRPRTRDDRSGRLRRGRSCRCFRWTGAVLCSIT